MAAGGPDWSTACPDWQRRIVAGESIICPGPLFPAEAESALKVFRELRLADVPGCPTMGEVCRPWFFEFVAAVFGAYDADSGRRLIREFFLLISKKNMKSTGAAGIMMTALIRNWRESAEFLILAPTIEIANNSYFPARDMVKKDAELAALFQVQDHVRTITHRNTGAFLKVVAADDETVGGKKATGILVDELWLFGNRPNAENMLREATGGMLSRPEGFVIYLTTQSDETPAGVFRSKLRYARGVRDGRIKDPRFLPVLYEFPPPMIEAGEHLKKRNFHVTNPNIDASVDREELERLMDQAQEGGDESMRGFISKHLNVEIGLALQSDRWAGADYWERAAVPRFTLAQMIERCEVIDVGIDGGGLDDLLAFGALGRCKETRDWMFWAHAWAHPSVLERRKSEAARFRDFERAGDLTIVENIGDDVEEVAALTAQIEKAQRLDKIGVDPHGLGGILDALEAAKVPKDKVIGISQGWKMVGAIKTAERRLADGGLKVCDQAMMAWCVGNAKVEPKGNAIAITKQAAGTAKIDPLMAFFNAVHLMALNPAAVQKAYSVFFVGAGARAEQAGFHRAA